MSLLKNQLKKLHASALLRSQRFRYRNSYTRLHDNLDIDLHIKHAASWLIRAQDSGADRGIAYGACFPGAFLPSYPETTGYIIPTFIALSEYFHDRTYTERAILMGDWEISVQMECGAIMGGRITEKPEPAIFNTGQVLIGWSSLFNSTSSIRYRNAGIRAADWMLSLQEPDGSWIRGNSIYANPATTVYNVKAALGLAMFGATIGNTSYTDAALRNADFACTHQRSNGWFDNCCLTVSTQPLLHTQAYTMQGLLGLGMAFNRPDLISATALTADSLITIMGADGFLPGRIDCNFRACTDWCCLTGSAQTSIVWGLLYQITGDKKYREAHRLINRYLMARHDISSSDPSIRGGVAGSWPVWGDYGQFMVLNWATKFFIDALLLETRLSA